MGVINLTPNSFSDGGELKDSSSLINRLNQFGSVDALDIGAESTAPMNASISSDEEWDRISPFLDWILAQKPLISIDTYHPETIFKIAALWPKDRPLIWNDVSGKFDHHVERYLRMRSDFHYVFCHNLAPTRELSGRHMDYLSDTLDLWSYFSPHQHPQVIFDPCLGFSKTYEQNWMILDQFPELQKKYPRWLLGFSRKSFLRKKFNLEVGDREELDRVHAEIAKKFGDGVWIRTHRPELL